METSKRFSSGVARPRELRAAIATAVIAKVFILKLLVRTWLFQRDLLSLTVLAGFSFSWIDVCECFEGS